MQTPIYQTSLREAKKITHNLFGETQVRPSPQRKWSQRHSPGSSSAGSTVQSLLPYPLPDDAPTRIQSVSRLVESNLQHVGTYHDENKQEGKQGNEDELFPFLFPQILLRLHLLYLFRCLLRFDDEG